jgi:hypothetical protein
MKPLATNFTTETEPTELAVEIRAALLAVPTRRVPEVRAMRREYLRRLKAAAGCTSALWPMSWCYSTPALWPA